MSSVGSSGRPARRTRCRGARWRAVAGWTVQREKCGILCQARLGVSVVLCIQKLDLEKEEHG